MNGNVALTAKAKDSTTMTFAAVVRDWGGSCSGTESSFAAGKATAGFVSRARSKAWRRRLFRHADHPGLFAL